MGRERKTSIFRQLVEHSLVGSEAIYVSNLVDLREKTFDLADLLLESGPDRLNGSISYWLQSEGMQRDGMLDWAEYGLADDFRSLVPPFPPTASAVYPHLAEGEFAPNQFFGTGIAIRDIWTDDWTDRELNHATLVLHAADGRLLQMANVD